MTLFLFGWRSLAQKLRMIVGGVDLEWAIETRQPIDGIITIAALLSPQFF